MQIVYQKLLEADIPQMVRLENTYIKMPFCMPGTEKHFREDLIPTGLAYGAFTENELIGKVGFLEEQPHIFRMVVDAKYRKRRVSTQLAEWAIGQLRAIKLVETVTLHVHPENSPAIKLYLKLGFIIKDWLKNRHGPGQHRLRMEKDLTFVYNL